MQVLRIALVLFTSCSFIQEVSFQLWRGAVTAFTFMASYIVMVLGFFGVFCFVFFGGGEGRAMGGKDAVRIHESCKAFCSFNKFEQLLDRIVFKGQKPSWEKDKSCFIEWTSLFQRQASGDNFLVPVSCAPAPHQLLPFYFHQCVHHGARLSFAMCSANESGGWRGC